MKRIRWLIFLAASGFVGQNLESALHELSNAAVTLALGGKVESIQPWHFLGTPVTLVSHLSPSGRGLVALSGMLIPNALGVTALLVLPWRKISPYTTTILTVPLCFFIIQSAPLALQYVTSAANEGSTFVLYTGCDPLLAALLGSAAFVGSMWLWFHCTRFTDLFRDVWSELGRSEPAAPAH